MSDARRKVKPINRAGITPAPVDSSRPEYRWVDPCALVIDETYQRNLSDRSITLIRKIVAAWDWSLFSPPVVADVDGALEIIDGQHRAIAAATHPEIKEIPVQVVGAGDASARARAFVGLNMNRLAMTSQQIFFARLNSGDPIARKVVEIAEECGVKILKYPPGHGIFKPGDTMAIALLQRMAKSGDDALMRRVLKTCADGRLAPVSMNWLVATSICLRRKLAKEADITLLMRSRGRELEGEARSRGFTNGVSGAEALATIIAEACRGR